MNAFMNSDSSILWSEFVSIWENWWRIESTFLVSRDWIERYKTLPTSEDQVGTLLLPDGCCIDPTLRSLSLLVGFLFT